MRTQPIRSDFFQGAVSLQPIDAGLKPWRVHFPELPLYCSPGESLIGRAECAAGVRLRFTTDSRSLVLTVGEAAPNTLFDLTCAGVLLDTQCLAEGETEVAFENLPGDAQPLEIWLPQGSPVIVKSFGVDDNASLEPAPDARKRWVTYGSSITHCGAAHSPSRTWPATAARLHDLHLTCLGYGGNCHMEPMMARMIRDLPADFITLKVGINIYGGASLGPRTFKAAAVGLVKIIREKHPETPIALVSPIISPNRESNPNAVNLTLELMRVDLKDAVSRLQACGDENLIYVDGLKLFAADQVEPMMPDALHPNGDGYEYMGHNFAEHVLTPLGA